MPHSSGRDRKRKLPDQTLPGQKGRGGTPLGREGNGRSCLPGRRQLLSGSEGKEMMVGLVVGVVGGPWQEREGGRRQGGGEHEQEESASRKAETHKKPEPADLNHPSLPSLACAHKVSCVR